jgi:hypothetical protein
MSRAVHMSSKLHNLQSLSHLWHVLSIFSIKDGMHALGVNAKT